MSPFPTVFSRDMYCKHTKTQVCFGKGFSIEKIVQIESFADDKIIVRPKRQDFRPVQFERLCRR